MIRKRVLVVDDEKPALFAMHSYLSQQGFEVECAQEAEEAEALLSNVSFDILVTDLRLTPIQQAEGLDVIGFVRARALNMPVIVLSAGATLEVETEARRLGIAAFIRKPVSLAFVAATLRNLLEDES